MINPFSKRNIMSSSERIKKRSNNTITRVLNTKGNTHRTKNIMVKDRKIKRVINHEFLLKLTKGYTNMNAVCTTDTNLTNSIGNGNHSYIDFCDLDHVSINPCCLDTVYILNKCREKNGIITPQGKIAPKTKDRILKYPIPIEKIEFCRETPQQYTRNPNIHKIEDNICHTHFFPTNEKMVSYHNEHYYVNHPEPFPFPNYESTNFMSKIQLKEYNKEKKAFKYKKKCCSNPNCNDPNCKGDNITHHHKKPPTHHAHSHHNHGHTKFYNNKINNTNKMFSNHVAHDRPFDHVVPPDSRQIINEVKNNNKTNDWVRRSKEKRNQKSNEDISDWGSIDHEEFNFDLNNDPYLDLIPEWRKDKLREKARERTNPHRNHSRPGHTSEYSVFNKNFKMK